MGHTRTQFVLEQQEYLGVEHKLVVQHVVILGVQFGCDTRDNHLEYCATLLYFTNSTYSLPQFNRFDISIIPHIHCMYHTLPQFNRFYISLIPGDPSKLVTRFCNCSSAGMLICILASHWLRVCGRDICCPISFHLATSRALLELVSWHRIWIAERRPCKFLTRGYSDPNLQQIIWLRYDDIAILLEHQKVPFWCSLILMQFDPHIV